MVTIDDRPAVCHNLDCDFEYVDAVGEVTEFTFDSGTKTLVVEGTDLPLPAEIEEVWYANKLCVVDASSTATYLTCVLSETEECGTW